MAIKHLETYIADLMDLADTQAEAVAAGALDQVAPYASYWVIDALCAARLLMQAGEHEEVLVTNTLNAEFPSKRPIMFISEEWRREHRSGKFCVDAPAIPYGGKVVLQTMHKDNSSSWLKPKIEEVDDEVV